MDRESREHSDARIEAAVDEFEATTKSCASVLETQRISGEGIEKVQMTDALIVIAKMLVAAGRLFVAVAREGEL